MAKITANVLKSARHVLATAGVSLPPLVEASVRAGHVEITSIASKTPTAPIHVEIDAGIQGGISFISSMAPNVRTVGAFVRESGLFGDPVDAAAAMFFAAAKSATALVADHLPEGDIDTGEMAVQELAARIAHLAGLGDAPPAHVNQLVISAFTAESAGDIELLRRRIAPAILAAGEALRHSPEVDITPAAIAYYAGADLSAEAHIDIVPLRIRAAESCPALAGFMASLPEVAEAIDAQESLMSALSVATGGLITKPVFTRIAHARTPGVREMVMSGAFKRFPPDQIPKDADQWEIAEMIWTSSRTLAVAIGMDPLDVWRHDRFAYARGDWRMIGEGIVRKSIDLRPPFDSGLPGEVVPVAARAMCFEALSPHENVCRRVMEKVSNCLDALETAEIDLTQVNHKSLTAWALRNCAPRVSRETIADAFEAVNEACSMFGLRVVLPTILTEMQLPGAPVTPHMMAGAASTAFEIMGAGNSVVALADLGGQFRTRAPLILRQLVARSEIVTPDIKEATEKTHEQRTGVPEELKRKDAEFRQMFRYDNDAPEWPGVTPIIEVMNGVVVVPLTTIQQALEEGSSGKSGHDRCGVYELENCIGTNHAPNALVSRGVKQTISFRSINAGGYRRLADAVIDLYYDKNGKATFDMPAMGHFKGQKQNSPPKVAQEAMQRYMDFLANNQNVIPPGLAEDIREYGKPGGVTLQQQRRVVDISLARLLGYEPCKAYKLETVWGIWIQNNLVNKKWASIPLDRRLDESVSRTVRAAIRRDLKMIGITGLDTQDTAKSMPVAGQRQAPPARVQRLSGIFT